MDRRQKQCAGAGKAPAASLAPDVLAVDLLRLGLVRRRAGLGEGERGWLEGWLEANATKLAAK